MEGGPERLSGLASSLMRKEILGRLHFTGICSAPALGLSCLLSSVCSFLQFMEIFWVSTQPQVTIFFIFPLLIVSNELTQRADFSFASELSISIVLMS